MTARPIVQQSRRKPLQVAVALCIVLVAVLLAAACVNENNKLPFEISGVTSVVVPNATSSFDLQMKSISNPDLLELFPSISRFDVVTFDVRAIRTQLKTQQSLPVRIRGKEYLAELHRIVPVNSDSGFESYSGTLSGERNSSVMITINPTAFILGVITLNGETFWIIPVDKEARNENNPSILHVIYRSADAPHYQNPNVTDITPSDKYLHSSYPDEKTGNLILAKKSRIGNEYPTIDGDHAAWSWVYYGKRGLTLYTISTGNYTEIKAEPFGLSPPKISGKYLIWADSAECLSQNQKIGLVLYDITTGNKTCFCKNPQSPRNAEISGNYIVWQDPDDIHLYNILTQSEAIVLPDSVYRNPPSIDGDKIVWGETRGVILYNISAETATVLNLSANPDSLHIYRDIILMSAGGGFQNPPVTVSLYNITTGTEQTLVSRSAAYIGKFSMSGNFIVWTEGVFPKDKGDAGDIPDYKTHLFDLKKGYEIPGCLDAYSPSASISGNNVLFYGTEGIALCSLS